MDDILYRKRNVIRVGYKITTERYELVMSNGAGGECAVELSGVLQLVRQPHHLQQNVKGVSRRVP